MSVRVAYGLYSCVSQHSLSPANQPLNLDFIFLLEEKTTNRRRRKQSAARLSRRVTPRAFPSEPCSAAAWDSGHKPCGVWGEGWRPSGTLCESGDSVAESQSFIQVSAKKKKKF